MKQKLLMMLLLLGTCSIGVAQTKSTNTEEDGFDWIKIRDGELYGAEDMYGNTLVPTKFSYLSYEKYDKCFHVTQNGKRGAYTIDGKYSVDPSQGYSYINLKKEGKYYFFEVTRNGYKGVCDIDGREIISPDRKYTMIIMSASYGIPYFTVYTDKKHKIQGICDLRGNEIVTPQKKRFSYSSYEGLYSYKGHKHKPIEGKLSDYSKEFKGFGYTIDPINLGKPDNANSYGVNDAIKVEREKHAEKDGYVWYLLTKDKQKAAEDENGKMIIPYQPRSFNISYFDGFFKVGNSTRVAAYERSGRNIIPLEREYKYISKHYIDGGMGYYYSFEKYSERGICDANGKELLSPSYKYKYKSAYVEVREGVPYIIVEGNDGKEGICNIKGEVIISPEYESVLYYYGIFKTKKSEYSEYKDTDISIHSSSFSYNKNEISFTPSVKENLNYADRTDINKTLQENLVDDYKWYLISKDGRYGAMALNGETLVPMRYESLRLDPFNDGFIVQNGKYVGLYTLDGKPLIPIERNYKDIFKISNNEYGYFYRVAIDDEHVGACDENGKEILSPQRGSHDEVILTKWHGHPFALARREKDGRICAYTMDGRFLLTEYYYNLGISEVTGTFTYTDENGKTKYTLVTPEGRVIKREDFQTRLYGENNNEKSNGNRWLSALATGLANAASLYLDIQMQKALSSNTPATTPRTTYSGSSDYYSSSAYVADLQARSNKSAAYYKAQFDRIGQQALANTQQGINRISQMYKDLGDWMSKFNSQNGRYPNEYEKTQWVRMKYPDMLENYILSQGAVYEKQNQTGNTSSQTDEDEDNRVDYRSWYKRTEENIENLHRSFSSGSSVTTNSNGGVKDNKNNDTSGSTYLQVQQTYKKLQKQLKNIREEAATSGINITPSRWETSELKP